MKHKLGMGVLEAVTPRAWGPVPSVDAPDLKFSPLLINNKSCHLPSIVSGVIVDSSSGS